MKQISLLLIVALFSLGTFAQVEKKDKMEEHHESHKMKKSDDHEARAMIYADKMATRLSLNMDQKEKIKKAQMKRLEDQKDLMADMMADESSEMHEEKMKIQEDFKEEMKEILTASQFKKWQPMHERELKMHAKHKAYKKDKDKIEKETDY